MTSSVTSVPARVAIILSAVAVLLAGCAGPSERRGTTTLRFAYFSGEATSFGRLWSWWMDEVEHRSGGSITFDRFWDASLLKGPEMVDGLRDRRVDVAQVVPPMYPGKFPLASVTELPFVSDNVPAGAQAILELSRRDPAMREEWDGQGLVPLAWNIASPGALGTTEPVRTAEDLRGRSIRGNDRSSQVLQMAGANMINIDLNDIYTGTERGLLSGFFGIPFAFVGPLKFPEVAKYYTNIGMGITTANALSMSREGWAELTPEQQRIMVDVSTEVPARLAGFEAAVDTTTCKAVRAAGASVSELPTAEVEELRAAGEERVRSAWIAEAGRRGEDGAAFYRSWVDGVHAAEADFPDFTLGMTRCMAGGGGNE